MCHFTKLLIEGTLNAVKGSWNSRLHIYPGLDPMKSLRIWLESQVIILVQDS